MVFLSLIVRCYNEIYIEEFIDYYLSEGVDIIYIIHDIKSTIPIPDKVKNNSKVIISQSTVNISDSNKPDFLWKDTNELYSKIRHTSEWFIYVDCDEFINTRKNSNLTIRDELMTTFKNSDCIKIPWIMMACNKREQNPPNILQHIVHRWNHNKRHPHPTGWNKGRCRYDNIQVKCIFKSKIFHYITDHCPHPPLKGITFNCVDGVYNRFDNLNPCYKNLREKDINNAYMVCHHYRIVSKQNCRDKFINNGFASYRGDFNKLWLCDYSEIEDNTLKTKSKQKFGEIVYI